MSAVGKKRGRRYGREVQQEDRSEGQIKDRFAELGWPCDRVGRDLGEDLHVRIFDDGRSTGLSFDVQLKSAADAERLKRRKSPAISYRLDVKDLLHWEVATTLLVLVVWDVEKREGWWRPIPEIIKALNEAGKGWRTKKTATAMVPLANTTDVEGMRRLRWTVADHCMPLVPKPEESELTLHFPKTPEGAAAFAELKRAFDDGDAVKIGGEALPLRVEYPEWHRRIYGEFDGPVRLEIHESTPSVTIPLRIEAESSQGFASLPYVELRMLKGGRRRQLFSNEHQGIPLRFSIDFSHNEIKYQFKFVGRGRSPQEAREVAVFAWLIAHAGVNVRLIARDPKVPPLMFPTKIQAEEAVISELARWHELVERLCFVQTRLSSCRIELPEGGISHEDADAVERVFKILSSGEEYETIPLSFTATREARDGLRRDLRGGQQLSIGRGTEEPIRFLNCIFEPGAFRVRVPDVGAFLVECERQFALAPSDAEKALIKFEKLDIVREYLKWIPEEEKWERFSGLAGRQDGYVTLEQARRSGYTDDIFHALIPVGKVEQVAPDVYHLVQFPRAEREDLVVLWLQTDRRGVISHETALFLHDLCDILPSRLHITIPPDWSPQDQQFAANVKIRHGDVPEEDLRWLGAVPYTAPLRTLRDCIEVGVSPELIEQAIAEGIRRGLFTEADFPPSVRAESA